MKPGDKVIITFNPHHDGADKIIGTVKGIQPGAGVCKCDLVNVEYTNPHDGRVYVRPFGLHNIQVTSVDALVDLALYHEAIAKECWNLAQKVRKYNE
jgi:hypothetical protein